MKRLKFYQKDKSTLSTYPILCDKDILKGEISLNDKIEWRIISSTNNTIEKGESSSVEMAKKCIKVVLSFEGAGFETEKRKYKI